jgi:anti-sigma-K factor RskA
MEAVEVEAMRERLSAMETWREPSAGLTGRVMAAVRAERRRETVARNWRVARITAAACVVAACLVAVFLPARPGGDAEVTAPGVADAAADRLVGWQAADGSWSPSATGGREEYRPAITALALMALDRHSPLRHAGAIDRAEKALLSMQSDDGAFGSARRVALYNHSFATFALLGHAAAKGTGVSDEVRRAIDFSLASQDNTGSWGGGDASMTLWQVAILLKARDAGWTDDGGHLRRGIAWLRREGRRGAFDYRCMIDDKYAPCEGNAAMTAMAAMTLRDEAARHQELRETADAAIASLRDAMDRPVAGADVRDTYAAAVALLAGDD